LSRATGGEECKMQNAKCSHRITPLPARCRSRRDKPGGTSFAFRLLHFAFTPSALSSPRSAQCSAAGRRR
jgi:hypothetical protein